MPIFLVYLCYLSKSQIYAICYILMTSCTHSSAHYGLFFALLKFLILFSLVQSSTEPPKKCRYSLNYTTTHSSTEQRNYKNLQPLNPSQIQLIISRKNCNRATNLTNESTNNSTNLSNKPTNQ
jgi:hypothetical protein